MLCMSSECAAPGYLGCYLKGFHFIINDVVLQRITPR